MNKVLVVNAFLTSALWGSEGLRALLHEEDINPHVAERVVMFRKAVQRDMAAKFQEQKQNHAEYAAIFGARQLPLTEWEEVEHPEEPTWVLLSQRQRAKEFGFFAESADIQTPQQTGGNIGLEEPVRAVYRFLPTNSVKGAKKRLVLFIHGSFAHHREKFKSDQAPAFKAVLNYAELSARALPEHPAVDVISWSWTGYNEHQSRVQGGKNLAALLDSIHAHYSAIEIIAHSHGCNVVNTATAHMHQATIENAFYFACPVREYQPTDRIKNLYNFYSAVDKVQWAGSWDDSSGLSGYAAGFTRRTAWWRFDTTRVDINVMNIDCRVNNEAPGHSTILGALGGLYHIVRWIREKYTGCHEFIMHSVLEPDGLVLEILVALPPDEKCGSAQAHEYSHMALSLYQERSEREMHEISSYNRLFTVK